MGRHCPAASGSGSIGTGAVDDPDLLVLDEPTSHLDDDNAAWVRDAIDRLPPHVAVVLITHRPALLAGSHTVVTVDAGTIQQGDPSSS